MEANANRLAHHLAANGVKQGDHVGIYGMNSVQWVETVWAVFKLRATWININFRYVADELAYLFDNADLVALVYEEQYADRVLAVRDNLPLLRHTVVIGDGTSDDARALGSVPYDEALASGDQTLIADAPKLNPMYTPGFAAPEQYKNRETLGPWTDIYSIGASMFACLSGMAPQAADQRLEKDRMQPVTKTFKGKYARELLEIIDWCLEMDYLKRPQSVFSLQKAIVDNRVPEPQKATVVTGLKRMIDDITRPPGRENENPDSAG
jgi:acyl-CoA synthetase (AMP-forming)/AMP-acid ligase II